jgi:hypothetical protein
MALPKVATPTYELTIPSTGKKIKYRAFLVKEEKLLLMASEEGGAAITRAVKDVIHACAEGTLNVNLLAPFDIEYFFLQIRGKSVGDIIKISLQKPDSLVCEEKDCVKTCELEINVNEVEIDTSLISDGKIKITEEIGIQLKYPDLDSMQKLIISGDTPTTEEAFKMIVDSIDYIWEGEELFKAKDTTKKELTDFIESLTSEQFSKIKDFFEDMPKLSKEVLWSCSKCKKSEPVLIEGINSFFA